MTGKEIYPRKQYKQRTRYQHSEKFYDKKYQHHLLIMSNTDHNNLHRELGTYARNI